jgi:LPS-assembly protein
MVRLPSIFLALLLALVLPAPSPARAQQGAAAAAPVAAVPVAAAPVAAASAAKSPVTLEGGEVFITAEHLERDSQQRIIVGEGAVTIRHREMRMAADRVVYNEVTRDVVADGNVVLDSGADRIQGEHLELNIETRVGFFERAQGFLQTYYFTGERLEKRGPDHYFLSGGSFTTCEGVLPDWSFRATSTELTIDEYLTAWNPTLRIKKLPVLWFPYAVFPIKRDRSTGLLIPTVRVTSADGFTLGNAFYWAPRDNFDATIGVDYLAKTGWGASGEMRYLLAPRTQGVVTAYYQRNTATDGVRWTLATRNSQELPLGLHAEIDAFFQSDREFIGTQGKTIEERSSERTTSSFFINRNWASWNFDLSGRYEVSLLTEERTTLTRFPELRIDRTSTRLFGTGVFLKVAASGAYLERDQSTSTISTTRLHLAPEVTWPLSVGSIARVVPTAGYALTDYSENLEGEQETRALPYFKIGLEGPRPYRIWDLSPGGRFTKLKHLIEPSVAYVYTPDVDQENLPQFDAIDYIPPANRVEYSIINTLYAKKIGASAPAPPPASGSGPDAAAATAAQSLLAGFGEPTA